jgi:signal transduction histidine kinase
MKLIYRISLRLSLVLLPLIALWAVVFYFTMVDEINDEVDDALEDYSELIVIRMLSGELLPRMNEGSNNSYTIAPVDENYAAAHPGIDYYDAEVYIPEKEETEPARFLVTIFQDGNGQFYELKVATPTFEKDELLETILWWVVWLYLLLLITVVGTTMWIFHNSMRPLYALLHWLDGYAPGHKTVPVPNNTSITEFRRLNTAAQQAVDRSEELLEQQKQFIGNASHELQTPLAVLGGRMEYMLDHAGLDEQTMGEVIQMQRTLGHIVRLNKTLLLLAKIDNGQFPENTDVDISAMIREQKELYDDIYEERDIRCDMHLTGSFLVRMNESLASVLVSNLIRNAYVHSEAGARIDIRIEGRTLTVSNDGVTPLDGKHIFERFYQGSKREGSTGLGLALVKAVADSYGLCVGYRFGEEQHIFSVEWPQ